jgi:hypothetical protein
MSKLSVALSLASFGVISLVAGDKAADEGSAIILGIAGCVLLLAGGALALIHWRKASRH